MKSARLREAYFDEFDVEEQTRLMRSSHGEAGNDEADIFRIMSSSKKAWKLLQEINAYICQETYEFVKANKPTFDHQKHVLISIDNFIQKDLNCGVFVAIVGRSPYTGDYLDDATFSKDWNTLAASINNGLDSINKTILKENSVRSILQPSVSQEGTVKNWTCTKICQGCGMLCCGVLVIVVLIVALAFISEKRRSLM